MVLPSHIPSVLPLAPSGDDQQPLLGAQTELDQAEQTDIEETRQTETEEARRTEVEVERLA